MKKLWYLILIINTLPLSLLGQSDHYLTDSSKLVGIKLIKGSDLVNSKLCRVKKGDKVINYTPYDVKEYKFKDGRVYISKEIQISDTTQRVFLERLVKGNTTLYYYRGKGIKTYFIEKDSSLFVELPKSDRENKKISFHDKLLEITSDCQNVSDASKLVGYNKRSLTKLINRYDNCKLKPFPFLKYGLTLGYGATKLVSSSSIENKYLNQFDFKYEGGFTIGLFIDKPILVSDFSLHTELYYSQHGFSYNKRIENKDIDFIANTSTINLPIMIRYTFPTSKFRPYINTGGYFTHNLKNENALYEAIIDPSIIEINIKLNSSYISKNQIGYSIGAGLEYKLNYKNSLFIELRYNKLYGLSESGSLNNSQIHFFTGINF